MKVYIAGPMTGLPGFNYAAFNEAEERLRAAGAEVENPVRGEEPPGPDDPRTWDDFLRAAIAQLVTCDVVATLPGWETSKGAQLEVHIARALGMAVHPLAFWVHVLGSST